MVENIFLFLLVFILGLLTLSAILFDRRYEYWISPYTYVLLSFSIAYIPPSIKLILSGAVQFHPTCLQSVLFVVVFSVPIAYANYSFLSKKSSPCSAISTSINNAKVITILSVLCVVSNTYIICSGHSYTLYEDESSIHPGIMLSLLSLPASLVIPLLLSNIHVVRKLNLRSSYNAYLIPILTLFVIANAIISTAKAGIILLIFVYFASENLRSRKPRYSLVAALSPLVLVFLVYTYTVRYYGTVRGGSTIGQIAENITIAYEHKHEFYTILSSDVAGRSDYLTPLLSMTSSGIKDRGIYEFGSIVELANFIPRLFWEDRPYINFNYHATSAVWNSTDFSETPIGRIGEAFYVSKYFGVLWSFLYIGLFAFLIILINSLKPELAIVFYYAVLIELAFPDAYLLYNIKFIISQCALVSVVFFVSKFFSRINSRA